MFFRFEIEIEPIFGTLALYDVREKKRVLLLLGLHLAQSVFLSQFLLQTSYVMLSSCLANRVSLVLKGLSGISVKITESKVN